MHLLKKYRSALLLFLTLPLGELHTYWRNDATVCNWIFARPTPMKIDWNVKYAADQLVIIFYFLAWCWYEPNLENRVTVKCFCLLAVIDTLAYFYNYKTTGYGSVYLWFAALFAVVYYISKEKQRNRVKNSPPPP